MWCEILIPKDLAFKIKQKHYISVSLACLLTVGGSRSAQREPTQPTNMGQPLVLDTEPSCFEVTSPSLSEKRRSGMEKPT